MLNKDIHIIWEGNSVAELCINKGDALSIPVYNLAMEVCNQITKINELKDLDFTCLGLKCDINTDKAKLKDYFQALLENDCKIKELVTKVSDNLDTSEKYIKSIDLKCLLQTYIDTYVTSLGKCTLDLDVNKILQVIINSFCTSITNYTSLLSDYTDIKATLKDFIDNLNIFTEPEIVSCLSEGEHTTSHVKNTSDPAICSLRENVGSLGNYNCISDTLCGVNIPNIEDFFSVISIKITPSFTYSPVGITYYVGLPDLVSKLNILLQEGNALNISLGGTQVIGYFQAIGTDLVFIGDTCIEEIKLQKRNGTQTFVFGNYFTSRNLATALTSQSIILCNLNSRLLNIENNCCTSNCSDIVINFDSSYDKDSKILSLSFTTTSGNIIPADFKDNGSRITITDYYGKSITSSISIVADGIISLDLSSLNASKALTISLKSSFKNTKGLTCSSCFSKNILLSAASCNFCELCATGPDTDFITLSYADDLGTHIEKITGGTCKIFDLSNGTPIINGIAASSDSITLENSDTYPCLDVIIPEIVPSSCWFFEFPLDENYYTSGVDDGTSLNIPSIPEFYKYFDTNNPLGLSLTNDKIYKWKVTAKSVPASLVYPDIAFSEIIVPAGLPSGVSVNNCTTITSNLTNIVGYGIVKTTTPAVPNILPFCAAQINFPQNIPGTQVNKFGLFLTIPGQITSSAPKIQIISPNNGVITSIEGQQLDDCSCPISDTTT